MNATRSFANTKPNHLLCCTNRWHRIGLQEAFYKITIHSEESHAAL